MATKMHVFPGNDFKTVAKRAQEQAIENNNEVCFNFNDIICTVSSNTNLDWLYRDYMNSFLMGWKNIGPDFEAEYSEAIQIEMKEKQLLREEHDQKLREKYLAQEELQREAFYQKTEGLSIFLSNPELWESGKAKNTDSYGACIYEYAESWAMLMQVEMANGASLHECAEKTSFELGYLGITGYMYGAAVGVLSACWVHGESLRKWHNKSWGHEGKGVVNPAMLTIPSTRP